MSIALGFCLARAGITPSSVPTNRLLAFPSNEFLGGEDLTEHREEVGNGKLRPKERVLARPHHADTRGLGKIAPYDFAGRLHVSDSWYSDSTCTRNDCVEIECVVPTEVLVSVLRAIAEGEELHHEVRERLWLRRCDAS